MQYQETKQKDRTRQSRHRLPSGPDRGTIPSETLTCIALPFLHLHTGLLHQEAITLVNELPENI